MNKRLKDLSDALGKLKSLCDNPEVGMAGWIMMFGAAARRVMAHLVFAGIKVKKDISEKELSRF